MVKVWPYILLHKGRKYHGNREFCANNFLSLTKSTSITDTASSALITGSHRLRKRVRICIEDADGKVVWAQDGLSLWEVEGWPVGAVDDDMVSVADVGFDGADDKYLSHQSHANGHAFRKAITIDTNSDRRWI